MRRKKRDIWDTNRSVKKRSHTRAYYCECDFNHAQHGKKCSVCGRRAPRKYRSNRW